MMIIEIVFKHMLRRFYSAMGFHCNQETTKHDDKKMALLARNSLMSNWSVIQQIQKYYTLYAPNLLTSILQQ